MSVAVFGALAVGVSMLLGLVMGSGTVWFCKDKLVEKMYEKRLEALRGEIQTIRGMLENRQEAIESIKSIANKYA